MKEMIFVPSDYSDELLDQVALALEARARLQGKQKYPRLQEKMERWRAAKPEVGENGRAMQILHGILLAAGLFLLIPGLTDPVGLAVPLLVGIVGTGVGLYGLLADRLRGRRRPFTGPARRLLRQRQQLPSARIVLGEDGLEISGEEEKRERHRWKRVDCCVETEELLLLSLGRKLLLLQKKDLQEGDLAQGRELLRRSTHLEQTEEKNPAVG